MSGHEHPNVTLAREGFEAFDRGDTAWMSEHMSPDVVWHVGGNSKWAGTYEGLAAAMEMFARQAQAMGQPPSVDIHDVVGNDDHVITIGTARATGPDGTTVEWKYSQIFHVSGGKVTEVWGMAENDAEEAPFLDALSG
jgi:ketosteroid isomerase-like protein